MIAVYPGSFDPITNGHLDIIERSSKRFEKVVVAILNNPSKKTMFSIEERVNLLNLVLSKYKNVEVDTFSGLLVDYAKQNNIPTVIRGLRAVTDFEYELQMALMNSRLNNDIETFFLMASSQYTFLSSSIVKEVAKFSGDISTLVPRVVEEAILDKIKGV